MTYYALCPALAGLTHPVCCHAGRCRVPHEALSVSWFHGGLISANSQRTCRVLDHPGEPFPESTHEPSAAW